MPDVDFLITLSGLGAVSDAVELRDAAMAASSTTLTSASANFVEEDVGKPIIVGNAGTAAAKLRTTIAAFVSATELTLADAAVAEVAGVGAVYGTDCSAALQAGLDALTASAGGTLVIDGLFLLATAVVVDFGGETAGVRARLIGSGSDSAIWIGTPDADDAIALTAGNLELRDVSFVGVPDARNDARRVFSLDTLRASFLRCGFYGLSGQEAVLYASQCDLDTADCMFGGCFVDAGPGYTNSVIDNKDWAGYRDIYSEFIDYGYFRGRFYSKSGLGSNLGWVRADSPHGTSGARGESVFRLRGTRLDEGALHGVVVKPTTGRVAHVRLEGLRQNVSPAETARGVHCEKVDWVVMEQCWQGWASTPALAAHFQDCGTVLIDSLELSDSVNGLSATNVASLTLKDTTGLTDFTFSNVNFHPVTSDYGNLALVKDGPIEDADFASPPALGTLAFDRDQNRLYLKRVTSGGWIYFDMSGGDVYGPELVVNGTFDNGTNGWTAANSAILSVVGGALRVTNGAVHGRAYQAVPTVVGQQYRVAVTIVGGTASRLVRVGTTQGAASYTAFTGSGGEATFTATTVLTYITLMLESETVGKYGDFDGVSLRAV
ncbi:MAG TPA: hypothetical protein VEA61_02920 [Allosphingosinicella sp.]|nr:hypothetical protein [Allosphingosinicella sp.]